MDKPEYPPHPSATEDYNHPINQALRARDLEWRLTLEKYLPDIAVLSFMGPVLLDRAFKNDLIPLLKATINLSTIIQELEAKGIELTDDQDDKWFGATEIIERLRKGMGK
jgi:hypothetical protein